MWHLSLTFSVFLFLFCQCRSDSTESPYVYLIGNLTDNLIVLKSTSLTVSIHGVIADVKIVQLYKNEGASKTSMNYIFPLSTQASVYAMQYVYDSFLTIAELKTNNAATKTFEEAVNLKEVAALAQQFMDQKNLVSLSISNIESEKEIRLELYYTEILVPDNSEYEFYFPVIAQPIYSDQSTINQPPDLQMDSHVFNFSITINPGMEIQSITTLPSDVQFSNGTQNEVSASCSFIGVQEISIKYVLASNQIITGVVIYQPNLNDPNMPFVLNSTGNAVPLFSDNLESFFLAIVQAPSPKYLIPEVILPREYIFILDTSASMAGLSTTIMMSLMSNLTAQLRENVDFLNLVTFAGSTDTFSPSGSVPATMSNLEKSLDFIKTQVIKGSTLILQAYQTAVAIPKLQGISRNILILTDGLVFVEDEIFSFIQNHSGEANFFAFAVGSIPNRYLTQGIATVGRGKEFWVPSPLDAEEQALDFISFINRPVLTSIQVNFSSLFQAYDVWPSNFGDVMLDRPLLICGKFRGNLPKEEILSIQGTLADGTLWNTDVTAPKSPIKANALPFLWAELNLNDISYSEIDDVQKASKMEEIALKYHLLSEYTSFVAVETYISTFPSYTDLSMPILLCSCPPNSCGNYGDDYCPSMPCGNCNGGSMCVCTDIDDCICHDMSSCICPPDACGEYNGISNSSCPSLNCGLCHHAGLGPAVVSSNAPIIFPINPSNDITPDITPILPIRISPEQDQSLPVPEQDQTQFPGPEQDQNLSPDPDQNLTPIPEDQNLTPIPEQLPNGTCVCPPLLCDPCSLGSTQIDQICDQGSCVPKPFFQVPDDVTPTQNCSGSLSGVGSNFLCSNGNMIFLSSLILGVGVEIQPNISLDGNLCVEGDLDISSSNILITDMSIIVTAGILKVDNKLTINMINFNNLTENSQVQIASAGNVVGTFKDIEIINPNNRECFSTQLQYSPTGIFLLFQFECPLQNSILIPVVIAAGAVVALIFIIVILAIFVKPVKTIFFPHRKSDAVKLAKIRPVPAKNTTYAW